MYSLDEFLNGCHKSFDCSLKVSHREYVYIHPLLVFSATRRNWKI